MANKKLKRLNKALREQGPVPLRYANQRKGRSAPAHPPEFNPRSAESEPTPELIQEIREAGHGSLLASLLGLTSMPGRRKR